MTFLAKIKAKTLVCFQILQRWPVFIAVTSLAVVKESSTLQKKFRTSSYIAFYQEVTRLVQRRRNRLARTLHSSYVNYEHSYTFKVIRYCPHSFNTILMNHYLHPLSLNNETSLAYISNTRARLSSFYGAKVLGIIFLNFIATILVAYLDD